MQTSRTNSRSKEDTMSAKLKFCFANNQVWRLFQRYSSKKAEYCSVDVQSYSNILSAVAISCSPNTTKFFPACLSCSSNFDTSRSSLGSKNIHLVCDSFEKDLAFRNPVFITADLSNLMRDLSLLLLLPRAFSSHYISFTIQTIIFYPID